MANLAYGHHWNNFFGIACRLTAICLQQIRVLSLHQRPFCRRLPQNACGLGGLGVFDRRVLLVTFANGLVALTKALTDRHLHNFYGNGSMPADLHGGSCTQNRRLFASTSNQFLQKITQNKPKQLRNNDLV